jgi:hypothetical protein
MQKIAYCIICKAVVFHTGHNPPKMCQKHRAQMRKEQHRKNSLAILNRKRYGDNLPAHAPYVPPVEPEWRPGYCRCGTRLSVVDNGMCMFCHEDMADTEPRHKFRMTAQKCR